VRVRCLSSSKATLRVEVTLPLSSSLPHSNRIYEKSFNNRCNRRKHYQEASGTKVASESFGPARYAPIAAQDQGRVIAAILNDSAEHAGKIYPLYGPKELMQYEVADILTQVLGRKITYVPVEIEAFSEIWKEMGYSSYIRQHISAVAQDCRDGVFPERTIWWRSSPVKSPCKCWTTS
jgi:hypothetical protein